MQKRCPNSKFIRAATLNGYKFVYDGYSQKWQGAVANIIESIRCVVWGGLFKVTESDIEKLDRCEGFPKKYQRKELPVYGKDRNVYKAFVYLRTGEKSGIPSKAYKDTVLEGAGDCGLDAKYIEEFLNITSTY
jgi:gamma-glutamylcyclotransferase (GGCT)/AIG2-like uncharacterized protein YtfP